MLINTIVQIMMLIFFSFHIVYFFVGMVTKPIKFKAHSNFRRFDFLIVARNEGLVIGDLIESIKQQRYPQDLIRIFVLADNCTDDTAEQAKRHGAITFINDVPNTVGKGLALKRLLALRQDYPGIMSDGVCFFDADNIVDAEFTTQINYAFNNPNHILIGYRGSKNFADNPTSMGSSLIFFREAHFLHHARNRLGLSTHINGTGFVVPQSIIAEGPWAAFSLIEDIEFTILQLIKHRKIIFVKAAKFYDEQPIHFDVSFKQRLRWIKGSIQIFFLHAKKLIASLFKKFTFSKLDLLIWITPLPSLMVILSFIQLTLDQINILSTTNALTFASFMPVYMWILNFFAIAFGIGAMTVIASWTELDTPWWKKLIAMITFPLYALSFLPLFFIAPFTMFNLKWYKTPHSVRRDQLTHDQPHS